MESVFEFSPPIPNPLAESQRQKFEQQVAQKIRKHVFQARRLIKNGKPIERKTHFLRQRKFLEEIEPGSFEKPEDAANLWRTSLFKALSSRRLTWRGLTLENDERIESPYPMRDGSIDYVTITPLLDNRTTIDGKPLRMAIVQHLWKFQGEPYEWRVLLWMSLDRAVEAFNKRSKDRA
ncbi:hypothetical protein A3F65_02965 [Candidatus Saccharibacteria bacterium RIFCSPHIGHO2_12_FULL_47_16b]|nr:MAG: hypothetical protein A3F65_02965 [Candidatus Saccharibacteria bacterium RIFCSPHIGHO2_12_FULL_47_16b]